MGIGAEDAWKEGRAGVSRVKLSLLDNYARRLRDIVGDLFKGQNGMEVLSEQGEVNSARGTYYQSATPTTIPQVQATFHKPTKSSETD